MYLCRMKREVLTDILITSLSAEGKGVGRSPEGEVLFVENTAPGDKVDVRLRKSHKTYAEAYPFRFHKHSSTRVEPFCKHFGVCGGCRWQHIPYSDQLTYKRDRVVDAIHRIAGISQPKVANTIGAVQQQYHRNKLEFSFSKRGWAETADKEVLPALGFHVRGRFDRVVEIDHCYLQPDPSNELRRCVSKYAQKLQLSYYDPRTHSGWLRQLLLRTSQLGELMVMLQVRQKDKPSQEALLSEINRVFSPTSLLYAYNEKSNDSYYDLPVHLYSGRSYIEEQLGHLRLRIGPKSFFQPHTKQALRMCEWLRDNLQGRSGWLLDLYAGVGSIGLFLAPLFEKVLGVECVTEAVQYAKKNARINDLHQKVEFVEDMVETRLIDGFSDKRPSVVVCDPPRTGLHPKALSSLIDIRPSCIVYVSCHPGTQARDLSQLLQYYCITQIQPVDLFPHTPHVESIVCLDLRDE